jgi:hypothetical protein
VLFALSTTLNGIGAWSEWLDHMRTHTRGTAAFRIGFKHFFMVGNIHLTEAGDLVKDGPNADIFENHAIIYYVVVFALLLPSLLAVRHLDELTFTLWFGFLAYFAFVVATRYYYSVVVVLLLLDFGMWRQRIYAAFCGSLFLLNALVVVVFELDTGWGYWEFIYNFFYTALIFFFVAAFSRFLIDRFQLVSVFRPGGLAPYRSTLPPDVSAPDAMELAGVVDPTAPPSDSSPSLPTPPRKKKKKR